MKNYLYMDDSRYFGQIAGGNESYGLEELESLGAKDCKKVYRGVSFCCDQKTFYKINLSSRLFSRFLVPIHKFKCHSTKYLYKKASEINWDDFLSLNQTFGIFGNVVNSKIKHSKYAMLVLKDSIADYFKNKYNSRPNVNRDNPDVSINLHIDSDFAMISIDSYGRAMHKRGYRKETNSAPMQETLAATLLHIINWDKKTKLYDPFCGSGTILCEASLMAQNIPPSFKKKKFGFMNLPDYNEQLFLEVKKEIESNWKPLKKNLIFGSDISMKAISAAQLNLSQIDGGRYVSLQKSDFRKLHPIEDAIIICNPPYGIRMSDEKEVQILLKEFGDFLKQKCKNCTAYIYIGDYKLVKYIGLKPSWKKEIKNGNLDGRFVKIEIY